jgi:hypothetical protein
MISISSRQNVTQNVDIFENFSNAALRPIWGAQKISFSIELPQFFFINFYQQKDYTVRHRIGSFKKSKL